MVNVHRASAELIQGVPVPSLPPLVEPAAELTREEVARYSRHLIIRTWVSMGRSG